MKKNENTPEIKNEENTKSVKTVEKAEKSVSQKQKKVPKTVLAKKLPKLFKKAYLPEKFEKNIIKKLYIDSDKELVKSIFKEDTDKKGRKVLKVPQTSEILKKDLERFKIIAKDIKNQKFAIKIVPLISVIVLCAAIGIFVTLFKNVLVKKAITSSMQGIFNAKCDVQSVDFKIFGASLEILNIEQANKDKPMSNIFQIGRISMNYNLTELLRGKFVAEEIAVTDVELDTERKTSGELKKSKESSEVKAEKKQTSNKMNELLDGAANELKALFESYNPEKMLENFQDELKSPETAKTIASDVQQKVEKWAKKPEEMKSQITEFSSSIESLTKKLNSADASQIPTIVKEGNSLLEKTNSLLSSFETVVNDIKTDSKSVQTYSKNLTAAINSDKNLVSSKVNELKSTFSASGLQKIMNNAVEGILYKYCGDYYPYVNQLTQTALSAAKNSSKAESTETTTAETKKSSKKTGIARSSGRDVYFKKDTVPKLLVKKLEASGKEYQGTEDLFHGYATDISSNMDQWGKPAVISADFKVLSHENNASVTVDARSSSKSPLVQANYTGNGYPLSFNAQVFDLTSATNILANLTAKSDGSWSVSGSLDMKVQNMNGMDFEPEQVCKIYKNALSKVSKLNIGFTVGYDATNGMVVTLENPEKLASQLVTPVVKAIEDELTSIAKTATENLTKLISEKTGIATEQISKFNILENDVSSYQKQLTKSRDEFKSLLEKKLKEQTSNAVSNALEKVTGNSSAASNLLNGLKKLK